MTMHIKRSAVLPYSAQALYELVNDVARYPEFLPWCSTAEVLEGSDEYMVASVGIVNGGFSQHFVTRNVLVFGKSIEMNLQEGPCTQLHGVWVFKSLTDKACKISLDLSFDYSGPIVRVILRPLFHYVANTLVDAFCQRPMQLHRGDCSST
ncbi:type II toxin-antitoxin system RatA family toxin [Candidatus Pseudomonas adelgestsugas]|uniref:Ribosome association toxin RatA n=1 Tax=Candidatus Pseudomonas adelgestsugas TaxID=1302376 RepID=A0ABX5R7T9_9PSED|nr:type II toxin-antitoxin system RatA family toxin [Candidatus Pseudomonas adelgestsugas]QAX81707.1 Ribosome association toxin RatA [Candidatus Pseudomonas adelgestsugas]